MGQINPFLDVLNQNPAPADRRDPALAVLRQFCQAIEQKWQNELACNLAQGFPTNYGQEFRVVIRSLRSHYEYTLLRAYVPLNGVPVKLDLYDYTMVDCSDIDALSETLRDFLARQETRDAIETYAKR